MQTVKFPKINLDVHFERQVDGLSVSIAIPTQAVNNRLALLHGLKQRLQVLPGLAPLYHHISRIEEAIVAAMEE